MSGKLIVQLQNLVITDSIDGDITLAAYVPTNSGFGPSTSFNIGKYSSIGGTNLSIANDTTEILPSATEVGPITIAEISPNCLQSRETIQLTLPKGFAWDIGSSTIIEGTSGFQNVAGFGSNSGGLINKGNLGTLSYGSFTTTNSGQTLSIQLPAVGLGQLSSKGQIGISGIKIKADLNTALSGDVEVALSSDKGNVTSESKNLAQYTPQTSINTVKTQNIGDPEQYITEAMVTVNVGYPSCLKADDILTFDLGETLQLENYQQSGTSLADVAVTFSSSSGTNQYINLATNQPTALSGGGIVGINITVPTQTTYGNTNAFYGTNDGQPYFMAYPISNGTTCRSFAIKILQTPNPASPQGKFIIYFKHVRCSVSAEQNTDLNILASTAEDSGFGYLSKEICLGKHISGDNGGTYTVAGSSVTLGETDSINLNAITIQETSARSLDANEVIILTLPPGFAWDMEDSDPVHSIVPSWAWYDDFAFSAGTANSVTSTVGSYWLEGDGRSLKIKLPSNTSLFTQLSEGRLYISNWNIKVINTNTARKGDVIVAVSSDLGNVTNQEITVANYKGSAPSIIGIESNSLNKLTLTFDKTMADPSSKYSQFTVLVNGENNTVKGAAQGSDSSQIILTLTDPVFKDDTVSVSYTQGTIQAANGTSLASFIQSVINNAPAKAEMSASSTTVTLGSTSTTVVVPSTVTNGTLNASSLFNPTNGATSALPATNALVTANLSGSSATIELQIPSGTTISAPSTWDGIIHLPTIQSTGSVSVTADTGYTAAVQNVIEVGAGDTALTFDKAVRLLIPGQAGKYAGFVRGNSFTKITNVCSQDSQEWADAHIAAGREAYINVGSDLVIWTKHFTQFVTYTQTVSSSNSNSTHSSGGGGGGSSSAAPAAAFSRTGSAPVYPYMGGKIGLGTDAVIQIPANALKATTTETVKVNVQKVAEPTAPPANYRFASSVYEFTVDGNNAYTFSKNANVSLTFNKIIVGDNKPAIFYYSEKVNTWVNVGGTTKDGVISTEVNHCGQFAVVVPKLASETVPTAVNDSTVTNEQPMDKTLNDIDKHWAKETITKLVGLKAISGYPDGTFKPDKTMTHGEFAVILAKALKLAPDESYSLKYKDAKDIPAWAKGYVCAVEKAGYTPSVWGSKFDANASITRAEMAYMVAKALPSSSGTSVQKIFKDQLPFWASPSISSISGRGIMYGYPDDTFKPNRTATRAEVCTVLSKAIAQ